MCHHAHISSKASFTMQAFVQVFLCMDFHMGFDLIGKLKPSVTITTPIGNVVVRPFMLVQCIFRIKCPVTMKAYKLAIFVFCFDMNVVILLCFTDVSTVFTFVSSLSNFFGLQFEMLYFYLSRFCSDDFFLVFCVFVTTISSSEV